MKSKFIICCLNSIFLFGCAQVKPWHKKDLAHKHMSPNNFALEKALDDHTYFSKEGSSGGRSFAGGGCGCN